jgi:hypothetical protein
MVEDWPKGIRKHKKMSSNCFEERKFMYEIISRSFFALDIKKDFFVVCGGVERQSGSI